MDPFSGVPSTEPASGSGLPRRALLKGAVAAGLAAGSVPVTAAVAGAKPQSPVTDWSTFDRLVQAAFDRFRLVGAAVAVVSADQVLHTATFGCRSLQPRRRVTPTTRFRVGSTSKSMTAALIATYVDQRKFGWDQPVIDVWPGFRAPTDQLTKTLRVRDLLGMDSGLGEPPATSELHLGDWTPLQLTQGIVNLPVLGPPGTTFFDNNSVNAVAGYLPFLADGVKSSELLAAYSNAMRDRILEPAGMSGATVADDPRGIVDDYAVGRGLDLRVKAYELPFGPLGGATPACGTLAHVGDMASWVQLQLRQGLSVTGTRVVSAANLAECWRGHIAMEFSTAFDPDAVGVQYGMGWINQTYKGNTTFVQHNGSIDGFTSLIGFFPQHDLGLVVLTNMNTAPVGSALFGYVQNLLLAQWFGLNQGTAERFLTAADGLLADFAAFGRQARRPDKKAVAPWLGYYDGGFSLGWQGSDLLLRKGPRAAQLVALPDGDYVLGTGYNIQTRVRLGRQPDGVPQIAIGELETVRRQTG